MSLETSVRRLNDRTSQWQRILVPLLVTIWSLCSGYAVAQPSRTAFLLKDAKIEGHEVRCICDTGASLSVADVGIRKRLPVDRGIERDRVRTALGTTAMDIYQDIEVHPSDLDRQRLTIGVADLSPFSKMEGQPIGGILGMDILRHSYLTTQGSDIVIRREPLKRIKAPLEFRVFDNSTGCPEVEIELPLLGKRRALIDTGSLAPATISREQFDALRRSGNAILLRELETLDAAGPKMQLLVALRRLNVLGQEFQNVPAVVTSNLSIGFPLLRRIDLELDFRNHVVRVNPEAITLPKLLPVDASGLQLTRGSDDVIRIYNIEPDSAASHSELRAADIVISIDGTLVSDFSCRELVERFLSTPGTVRRVTVLRLSKRHTFPLALSRNFEYPPQWRPISNEADEFFNALKEQSND